MRSHYLTRVLSTVAALALAAAAAPTLSATSYMPITDAALADRTPFIVEVRVVGSEPSPDGVRISTDYTVEIERVLKGEPRESTIVVRVPGGEQPFGIGLKVLGAPVFKDGERALLFLSPTRQGPYAVEQLMLGAFHRVQSGQRVLWLRDLSEAQAVGFRAGATGSAASDLPRQARRFSDWLADLARGQRRSPDYWQTTSTAELQNLSESFRLYEPRNLRWFALDGGPAVQWWTSSTGQFGLPGGGHAEFQRALAAWSDDPDTNVNWTYAGQSATIGSFGYYGGPDGINVVAFDYRDFGSFDCATGGLMSWSNHYYNFREPSSFRGREVYDVTEVDIATLPGIACLFNREPNPTRKSKIAEELFGHALGHALGLLDSSTNPEEPNVQAREALMYAFLHADGRGARLNSDDRQGLRQLYGKASAGPCRPSAATLCLQKSRFAVEAYYLNPYDRTGGTARAIRSTDVAGFFSFLGAANIELAVKILDFGDTFKVFYGQLTDFDFTLTVTDTKTGEVRSYQRASGDCGAVDPSAFSSTAQVPSAGLPEFGALTSPASACKSGPNTLCLLGGRFRAEVDWHNQFDATSGRGKMIRQSDLTGLVYYSDKSNLEMVFKVLDVGGTVKVFYAPLSDLEYTLRVTDLASQKTAVYRNGARESCGGEVFSRLEGSTAWSADATVMSVSSTRNSCAASTVGQTSSGVKWDIRVLGDKLELFNIDENTGLLAAAVNPNIYYGSLTGAQFVATGSGTDGSFGCIIWGGDLTGSFSADGRHFQAVENIEYRHGGGEPTMLVQRRWTGSRQ
jgi:hypothetical protein